jgi:hypothetical protein
VATRQRFVRLSAATTLGLSTLLSPVGLRSAEAANDPVVVAAGDTRKGWYSFDLGAWIVGTGGAIHESFKGPSAPNSEVRKAQAFGVIKLTLHPGGYDWRFVPTAGGLTDSGSDTCG